MFFGLLLAVGFWFIIICCGVFIVVGYCLVYFDVDLFGGMLFGCLLVECSLFIGWFMIELFGFGVVGFICGLLKLFVCSWFGLGFGCWLDVSWVCCE